SVFQFLVEPNSNELADSFSALSGSFFIPCEEKDRDDPEGFVNRFLAGVNVNFQIRAVSRAGVTTEGDYPSHGMFKPANSRLYHVLISDKQAGKPFRTPNVTVGNQDNAGGVVLQYFPSKLFMFSAERLNIGLIPFSEQRILERNAQNLPGVLFAMQQNPAL